MNNKVYEEAIEKFVSRLEKFLNVKSLKIDLKEMWKNSGMGDGRSLEQYLHYVGTNPSLERAGSHSYSRPLLIYSCMTAIKTEPHFERGMKLISEPVPSWIL